MNLVLLPSFLLDISSYTDECGKIEIKQALFVLVQVVYLVLLLFIYGCYAEQKHVTLKSDIM